MVVGLDGLDVIGEAIGRDGAHVDDQGAPELREVGRFFTVVRHDRGGTHAESDVGGKVLDYL